MFVIRFANGGFSFIDKIVGEGYGLETIICGRHKVILFKTTVPSVRSIRMSPRDLRTVYYLLRTNSICGSVNNVKFQSTLGTQLSVSMDNGSFNIVDTTDLSCSINVPKEYARKVMSVIRDSIIITKSLDGTNCHTQ